jgi:hypothetical protein
MEIKLKLPEWVDERALRLYAGIELVAEKYPSEKKWRVKKDRCSQCGACCSDLDERHFYGVVDGKCEHLKLEGNKYICKIALIRPFPCFFDPKGKIKKGICNITYETQ